jgi:signal transduction histidine kinase
VGFSLQRAYALIQQTRRDLFWLSLAAIGCGTLLTAVLAMRISKPIGQLVAAVHAFARGAYDRPIRTGARDEIGYLAHAFEQMRESVQRYLTSLKQNEAALQRKVDETRTLYEIGQEITAQVALEPTLHLIVERARELSQAESSLLALRQGASDTFAFQACSGTVPEALARVDFGSGEGCNGCTILTASPITVNDDLREDPESPFLEAITQMGVRSVVAVPLKARGTVIGVLTVTSRAAHKFHEEDQQLLSALADQAAIAIENAKLYEQVRQYAGELEAQVAVRTRELQKTNQQLAAASRHKSEFLANVSHELRTPLTAVKGSVDNMLDGLTGAVNDKQRRYLTRIKANTDRLSRLIHDLLDLSRIEAGQSDLQPTSLPVVALTQEVAEHLWPMAAEKHISLEVTSADASVMAWADREKVTQVLMNLIGNAVKFTPSHGTIAVAIQRSGEEWVQISVADTGPGIPADEATHIFEKFYQIATEGRQKTTGTGLGLAIAKSLVEMQRGQLWVESEVGRGSTFSFTLPVQQPVSLEVATHA